MSVNLRRFVDVNIARSRRNVLNPVRDTVALFGATTANTQVESAVVRYADFPAAKFPNFVSATLTAGYSSRHDGKESFVIVGSWVNSSNVKKDFTYEYVVDPAAMKFFPLLRDYAKMYFDNGGVKLFVSNVATFKKQVTVGGVQEIVVDPEPIAALPNEIIGVASMHLVADDDSALTAELIEAYNKLIDPETFNEEGTIRINSSASKTFVTNVQLASATTEQDIKDGLSALERVENLGYKYGKPGIEMTPLAYLSQINPYGNDTIHDYAFTVEKIDDLDPEDVLDTPEDNQVNAYSKDMLVGGCMAYNVNIDAVIANDICNVNGNLSTGFDIVNYYMTIVMTQTIEAAAVNALKDKPQGAEGTAAIYNAVVAELNKYNHSGLLKPANWKDSDWVETFNDETYAIVNANERLMLGYKLLVVPFTAMTSEQITAHECPPIYIAFTNGYGIRKIKIFGEAV